MILSEDVIRHWPEEETWVGILKGAKEAARKVRFEAGVVCASLGFNPEADLITDSHQIPAGVLTHYEFMLLAAADSAARAEEGATTVAETGRNNNVAHSASQRFVADDPFVEKMMTALGLTDDAWQKRNWFEARWPWLAGRLKAAGYRPGSWSHDGKI